MNDPSRHLLAQTHRLRLRWWWQEGVSVRLYETLQPCVDWFCVSGQANELAVVLDGEQSIEMGPERQEWLLRAGDACLLPAGTPHRLQVAAGTKIAVIDLSAAGPQTPGVAALPRGVVSLKEERMLARLFATGELSAGGVREVAARLFDKTATAGVTPLALGHGTLRMLSAKAELDRGYTAPVRIAELAARHKVDPHYFLRAFRRAFGVTPLAYVQHLRLDHFVRTALVSGAEQSLIESASQAGFGDYATFCRRMSKVFGRPPSRLVQASPF